MQIIDKKTFDRRLRRIAEREHKTPETVYQAMQDCINEMFANEDPIIKKKRLQLFPDNKVPTPEEFCERHSLLVSTGALPLDTFAGSSEENNLRQ